MCDLRAPTLPPHGLVPAWVPSPPRALSGPLASTVSACGRASFGISDLPPRALCALFRPSECAASRCAERHQAQAIATLWFLVSTASTCGRALWFRRLGDAERLWISAASVPCDCSGFHELSGFLPTLCLTGALRIAAPPALHDSAAFVRAPSGFWSPPPLCAAKLHPFSAASLRRRTDSKNIHQFSLCFFF